MQYHSGAWLPLAVVPAATLRAATKVLADVEQVVSHLPPLFQ